MKLRTWALKGSRPVLKAPGRRDQVSVISALSLEGELWFDVYRHTLNADGFIGYLDELQSFWCGRPLIVVTDRHPAHLARKTQEAIENRSGIELVFLPSYMPKLNPDESVWQLLKHIIHRAQPVEEGENIEQAVRFEMQELQNDPDKLRNIFGHPDLALYSASRRPTVESKRIAA